jgi:GNAT superfamily N-acetyltransferase
MGMATYTSDWRVRCAGAGDRAALRAFLDRLSLRTVQARYLSPPVALSGPLADRELERILGRNEAQHTVMLAVDGAAIRGVGEFLAEQVDRAELALVVEDAFQGRGIGRSLLRTLEQLARARGIRAFTGDIAHDNSRAAAMLRRTGRQLQLQVGYGSLRFSLSLDG